MKKLIGALVLSFLFYANPASAEWVEFAKITGINSATVMQPIQASLMGQPVPSSSNNGVPIESLTNLVYSGPDQSLNFAYCEYRVVNQPVGFTLSKQLIRPNDGTAFANESGRTYRFPNEVYQHPSNPRLGRINFLLRESAVQILFTTPQNAINVKATVRVIAPSLEDRLFASGGIGIAYVQIMGGLILERNCKDSNSAIELKK